MHGEVVVCAAEAGDKVVLEGADCSFCGVAAVHVGRYQLEIDLIFLVELFEGVGCFVIEPVCVEFETPLCEVVV